jgi:hypothetical protein
LSGLPRRPPKRSVLIIIGGNKNLLYMILERFKTPGGIEVYRRARDVGRLMPDGLEYVASWVDLDFKTCFQLMKTEHRELLDQWVDRWKDVVDFEIVPVRTSDEARRMIDSHL